MNFENAFDRVPKSIGTSNEEKGLPKVIISTVMSLYYGAKTKVRVRSELSEKFWVLVYIKNLPGLPCFLQVRWMKSRSMQKRA